MMLHLHDLHNALCPESQEYKIDPYEVVSRVSNRLELYATLQVIAIMTISTGFFPHRFAITTAQTFKRFALIDER
jgi:hypothetical protein